MNVENLKTCRYCAEKISRTARICPRCRQWLTLFSLRNTTILIWTLSLGAAILLVGFDVDMHKQITPGIDFFPCRNQVFITESHMIFGTNYNEEPIVSVTAIVTNQTDLPWKEIPLEVRFFDKSGTLIDIGERDYVDTLYPRSDGAIRIGTVTLRPFSDYSSYKIYVGSAKDALSRF